MKRILGFLLLLFSIFSLSACNTLQGAGEDIEQAGEELDEEL
ncbi:MAG: entericidin EcnAB [Syntrophotaleaceae bacterium]